MLLFIVAVVIIMSVSIPPTNGNEHMLSESDLAKWRQETTSYNVLDNNGKKFVALTMLDFRDMLTGSGSGERNLTDFLDRLVKYVREQSTPEEITKFDRVFADWRLAKDAESRNAFFKKIQEVYTVERLRELIRETTDHFKSNVLFSKEAMDVLNSSVQAKTLSEVVADIRVKSAAIRRGQEDTNPHQGLTIEESEALFQFNEYSTELQKLAVYVVEHQNKPLVVYYPAAGYNAIYFTLFTDEFDKFLKEIMTPKESQKYSDLRNSLPASALNLSSMAGVARVHRMFITIFSRERRQEIVYKYGKYTNLSWEEQTKWKNIFDFAVPPPTLNEGLLYAKMMLEKETKSIARETQQQSR